MHKVAYKLLIVVAALSLAISCKTESQRQEPVTTTPNVGAPSTSPSAQQAAQRDMALVRVIYAIPDKPTDLFAGEQKAFSNISYKTVTPYKEISDDVKTMSVKPAGKDSAEPLANEMEEFVGGYHYTVVAMPGTGADAVSLDVISDNLTPPATGKAKVRVINAAPTIKEIDVHAKGKTDPLFSDVTFETSTTYKEIDPISTTLEVTPDDTRSKLLVVPDVKFEAGKIYTIAVVGGTNNAPKLEAVWLEDRLENRPAQSGTGY